MLRTSATACGQNLALPPRCVRLRDRRPGDPERRGYGCRAVYDGISMRFVRWYDGDTGDFKSRFDILYGYAAVILRACLPSGASTVVTATPEPGSPGSHHSTRLNYWLLLAIVLSSALRLAGVLSRRRIPER